MPGYSFFGIIGNKILLMWFYSLKKFLMSSWLLTFAPLGKFDRGDYRTGKRLNLRKVIPYIASQFRKDKIWLRRTKPSKRQYQICLAIDDSSSMVDNHTKQVRKRRGGSSMRNKHLTMFHGPPNVFIMIWKKNTLKYQFVCSENMNTMFEKS